MDNFGNQKTPFIGVIVFIFINELWQTYLGLGRVKSINSLLYSAALKNLETKSSHSSVDRLSVGQIYHLFEPEPILGNNIRGEGELWKLARMAPDFVPALPARQVNFLIATILAPPL